MEITDVMIRKTSDDDKMKAIVSITLDNEFAVHDIKIIDGTNGLFVAMPSRRLGSGKFRDIAHPLTRETRARIRDAIFAEYKKALSAPDEDISYSAENNDSYDGASAGAEETVALTC